MLAVFLKGAGIAIAVVAVGVLLIVALGPAFDGKSTLFVINRGSQRLSTVTLLGSDGSRKVLTPVGAADSVRYELKRLGEAFFSLRITRSDGSGFRTPVGVMVSDNIGIGDTVFVSDSAFRVVPAPRQPYDTPETWPPGKPEPWPRP